MLLRFLREDIRASRRTYHVTFSSIWLRHRDRRSGRLSQWGRILRIQKRLLYYFRHSPKWLSSASSHLNRSGRAGMHPSVRLLLRQDTLLMSFGFCRTWDQSHLASSFAPLELAGRTSTHAGHWCPLWGTIAINPRSFLGRLFYFHGFQRHIRGNRLFTKTPPCMESDSRTGTYLVYRIPEPSDFSGGSDMDLDLVFMFGGRR